MIAEIEELVKEEKLENLILKLFLIVMCLVTIIVNSEEYKEVFLERESINTYAKMNRAIKNKEKYIVINARKADETRFSLENKKNSVEAKIYEINYGEKSIIVMLKNNTALTNRIKGELLKNDSNINSIKDVLTEENKTEYFDYYFSDLDYLDESLIVKKKFYISVSIIALLFLSMLHDAYKYFNPRKTFLYRSYVKRLSKELR